MGGKRGRTGGVFLGGRAVREALEGGVFWEGGGLE